MKHTIILPLLLFCCLQANGQDYLKIAGECFEKGDYECAKRNYTIFQTLDGSDMSAQIQKTDECIKILIIADGYFKDEEWEKASDRYQTLLEKNPKDLHAINQYYLCEKLIKLDNDKLQGQTKVTAPNNNAFVVDNRSSKAQSNRTSQGMSSNIRTHKPSSSVNTSSQLKFGLSGGIQHPTEEGSKLHVGGGISGEYLATPHIGIGLNAGYYVNGYFQNGEGIKGLQVTSYLVPVTLTGKYYLSTNNIQPYGGVDAGLYKMGAKAKYEGQSASYSKSYFGISPVVGLQIGLSDVLALDVNAKYNFCFSEGELKGIVCFNLGIVISFDL